MHRSPIKQVLAVLASIFVSSTQAMANSVLKVDSEVGKKLNLPVCEWSDPSVPSKGTIVAVHGLTFYAAAYDDLATHLAEKGYRFYAADMRGFGRWRDEGQRFNGDDQIHFTHSRDDVIKLMEAIRQKEPKGKIYCMGESLGANMALWAVETRPDLADGAILSALCYKNQVHPKPRWAVDFVKGLSNPNKRMNLTPYITPYLSHDKQLTKECMKDKLICRDLSPVELVKAQKTNKNVFLTIDQIPPSFPILVVAGEKDAVMKTKALPAILSKFGTKEISLNVLPKKGHLLLEHQKVNQDVASLIDRWLERQATGDQIVQASSSQTAVRPASTDSELELTADN